MNQTPTCAQDCSTCLPGAFDFSGEPRAFQVTVNEADGVHIAQIAIPKAGTYVPQHSHRYDHTTMLATGKIRLWIEGELEGDFAAPRPIGIRAGDKHTFLSLTDDVTLFCVHNLAHTGKVEVLEEHQLLGYVPPNAADPAEGGIATIPPTPAAEPDADGYVIAEEPWATFWRDGQALFAEHAAEVGPRNGVTLDINVPLIERLEAAGAGHIVTARCNGRLFGYLATIVSPSLEDRSMMVGTATAFYVSKDARGLGPRLLRTAIDMLKVRGVGEVILRAGVRGSGPKLGALYRRLGAQPHGELYSLILDKAA